MEDEVNEYKQQNQSDDLITIKEHLQKIRDLTETKEFPEITQRLDAVDKKLSDINNKLSSIDSKLLSIDGKIINNAKKSVNINVSTESLIYVSGFLCLALSGISYLRH
jgi:hypothetical protein